jgi:rRNA-processing protein FCF1
MRVRLAPDVEPERAIALIKELAGNKATAIQPVSHHPVDKRDDYVRWSTTTQARLESVLRRRDAQSFFESSRHLAILSMPPGNQLTPLIYAELDARATALGATATFLEGQVNRLRRAPGIPIVPDSNVWLHCQRLDKVDWRSELKEPARVMVPLRVIEEIDAKKYSRDEVLQRRARTRLPWLNGLFPDGDRGPVPLRSDATLELLLSEAPRIRPADADEEILDVSQETQQFVGRGKLLTGDSAMLLRARTIGIDVMFVPKGWLVDAAEKAPD